MKPLDITKVSPKELYATCIENRSGYLQRAQDASKLTIPSLYPRVTSTQGTTYPTPYQSVGARGVNNLANKLVMTLFPPNQTFFKSVVPKRILAEMGRTADDIKPAMAMAEQETIDEMEESGLRPKLVYASSLLLVGGSVILHVGDKGTPRVYKLDSFGVKRDARGNVLKMCIKESLKYSALESTIRSKIPKDMMNETIKDDKELVDIYTCFIRHNDKMVVFQSVNEFVIIETKGIYAIDECPYQFIPFVDRGEDFGRSYLEDYIGDLQSLEGLRQATLEVSAEAARVIYLLDPAATISLKALQGARSGDVLVGSPNDVSTIQQNKMSDLSITNQEAERIRQDLSSIFLLDSAVRRNAERVTAEEIMTVSRELEVAMGGVYSTLTPAQKILVKLYMKRCMAKGSIPKELSGILKAEIITGSAALGRGTELGAISQALTLLQNQLGVEQYLKYVKPRAIITNIFYASGLNPVDLVKTDEEMQAEQQAMMEQQQQQTVLEAAAPVAAQGAMQNGEE